MDTEIQVRGFVLALGVLFLTGADVTRSARAEAPSSVVSPDSEIPARDILTPRQWEQLNRSVDRALAWIAGRQRPDGSFPTLDAGQPGVTALCVLAFLSRGHLADEGPYGTTVERGIAYVLQCQHPNGLIAKVYPRGNTAVVSVRSAAYNHAIGGLMLSEAYGMSTGRINRRIRSVVEKALAHSFQKLPQPKRQKSDEGGWRYEIRSRHRIDSDLSITSWNLMFLRSCKNSGFDVPAQQIDDALAYVRRCFDPKTHTFQYEVHGIAHGATRAMVGAGILAFSLGGQHGDESARQAAEWLLRHPFDRYLGRVFPHDRFFYGAFYCSQGMFQLGGRYWEGFYPILLDTLATHQHPDGSWDRETWRTDASFGTVYTTAMAVLALSPPYQLLPIFQR